VILSGLHPDLDNRGGVGSGPVFILQWSGNRGSTHNLLRAAILFRRTRSSRATTTAGELVWRRMALVGMDESRREEFTNPRLCVCLCVRTWPGHRPLEKYAE
jgi:hypothetical protein